MMRMLLWLVIKFMCQGEVRDMAVVYATLIVKGKKTIGDVPERIREQVRQVLIDLDCPELAGE